MDQKRLTLAASRAANRRRLRRVRLKERWRDETNFLLRNPAHAKRLLDSIAELDRWAAILDRFQRRAHGDAAA